MSPDRDPSRSVSTLRNAFDAAFARAPAEAEPPSLDLLRIGVASRSLCLNMSEISAVHREFSIVAVPSPSPALRGLAALRGRVVPVYDLSVLLGLGPAAAASWLVELKTPKPCALSFEALEAQLRVPESDLAPAAARTPSQFFGGSVTTGAIALPLLDPSAIYAELTHERAERSPTKTEGQT
jgi:chemotaxis signal transduction protein